MFPLVSRAEMLEAVMFMLLVCQSYLMLIKYEETFTFSIHLIDIRKKRERQGKGEERK